jgi:hypothetical protein
MFKIFFISISILLLINQYAAQDGFYDDPNNLGFYANHPIGFWDIILNKKKLKRSADQSILSQLVKN